MSIEKKYDEAVDRERHLNAVTSCLRVLDEVKAEHFALTKELATLQRELKRLRRGAKVTIKMGNEEETRKAKRLLKKGGP